MLDGSPAACTLLLGDCLDRMAEMADDSIDLTVTSPPYDNLRTYNGTLNDWTAEKWQAILRELFRVTKQGGVVVWVVGDATIKGSETGTSFKQALYAMECGFRLHDTMIYEKAGTGACGSRKAYWQGHEYMFTFAKGEPNAINLISDRVNMRAGSVKNRGRLAPDGSVKDTKRRVTPPVSVRTNVWRMHSGKCAGFKASDPKHPAKFPEALARDHILSWSNPGDTVFDPFLGSGTTGKMALAHGRQFVGIERDPAYFEIARNRIEGVRP
jgi:site-specific DNA-methyltransferase (adenine-specific)